jgi:steroid delta-isomerase-like uncharacterized protein
MGLEENIRAIGRSMAAYNTQDFEGFAEPFTKTATYHSPNLSEPLKSREEIRHHFAEHPASFPDAHIQIERSFGQDDHVCVEFVWTATHKGPLPGSDGQPIPATNKSVRLLIVAVYRFEEGQISEAREYWDQVAFMTQLGLFP